jgi:hypothetical protein
VLGELLGDAMSHRRRLPNRRFSATATFWHKDKRYHMTVGVHDDGTIGDLFLNSGKAGSDQEILEQDAATILSVALQYGTPISVLRHSLAREADGSMASSIGKAIERLSA